MHRNRKSGFTLVEILIVVIILGILAAIVIPQFTNASEDARESALVSQLQTLRSQLELYKLQHRDMYPTDDGTRTGTWDWTLLTGITDEDGAAYVAGTSTTGPFGPYLQDQPVNNVNSLNGLESVAGVTVGTTDPADTSGWVFDTNNGKLYASNKDKDGIFAE